MKLSNLKQGDIAIIDSINADNSSRLVELGFSKNAVVEYLFCGMTGKIRAYKIKNTIIALRNSSAELINVSYVDGEAYE